MCQERFWCNKLARGQNFQMHQTLNFYRMFKTRKKKNRKLIMSEQHNISGLLQSFAQVTYRKTMPCISNHASHWLPMSCKSGSKGQCQFYGFHNGSGADY